MPSEGRVTVSGKDTLDPAVPVAWFRREAALCIQSPEQALFEAHVADDVAFAARARGLRGAELYRRVRETMDAVGLPFDDFADRETAELSGGEARLAALAGVLVADSPIVMLDEPAAGLDAARTALLAQTLDRLKAAGKTVIVTTHQRSFASRFDRVISMKGGHLQDGGGTGGAVVPPPLPQRHATNAKNRASARRGLSFSRRRLSVYSRGGIPSSAA